MKNLGFKELSKIPKPFEQSLAMTKGYRSMNCTTDKKSRIKDKFHDVYSLCEITPSSTTKHHKSSSLHKSTTCNFQSLDKQIYDKSILIAELNHLLSLQNNENLELQSQLSTLACQAMMAI